jgi:HlyD family secretion protein
LLQHRFFSVDKYSYIHPCFFDGPINHTKSSQFHNKFSIPINYTLSEKKYKHFLIERPVVLRAKIGSSPPPRKQKIIWITAVLGISILLAGYLYYTKVFKTTGNANTSGSQTTVVRPGDLTVSASGSGTLVAQSDASFGFDTSGQVTQVNVKVGDQVEAGQVLAQLDDTLARMKYEGAQRNLQELYSAASIATIQEEIAAAQDTEATAKEWLAYLISPDVAEAEDNLAIARQKLTDAQATAKASPSTVADQAVKDAQESVDYLNDILNQAWTTYNNEYLPDTFGVYENAGTRRHPKQVLATTTDPITGKEVPDINNPSAADLTTAKNDIAQAQQTISEGQAYLDILNSGVIPDGAVGGKITSLYEAQLALENAQSDLDATLLVAPISGTVTSLDLNVGQQAGTASVVTISQLSQPYTLDAYVDESDWPMARVGNKVNVTFNLIPGQTYPGTVSLVYPELSPSFETSVVHLVVKLDKSLSQTLPVGTSANVEVIGGEARGVLLVPVTAVHKGTDGKSYVTVLQNGQKLKQEVTIGLKNDTYAEVKSGLQGGEIAVTK